MYDLSNFVVGIKHKSSGGRPLTDSMIFQWTFQVDDTGYLADAGIHPGEPADARYALAVSALTLHWYDNRQAVDTNLTDLPLGLRQVINQLKAKGVRGSEA